MRPLLRYHGGKWLLAAWITSYFPPHRIYVEPYGGGGSVLLRKSRSYGEIYNDLDSEVVNVFRVARDNGAALRDALTLTPFSREEFEGAYHPIEGDDLERARRAIIRAFMGFGSSAVTATLYNSRTGRPSTGFRSNSNRSGTTPAHDWKNYADCFEHLVDRLRGFVIENKDALEVMAQHDAGDAVHYVDPPYVMETRSDGRADYRFEMTDEDHVRLASFLRGLKGCVFLSGYDCPLYREIYADWHRVDRAALADGAAKRVESLWISPNARPAMLI